MAALIGNKRQRSGSGEAETRMVIEDEGDEGANGSRAAIDRVVIDRIEWAKIDRTEIDRVVNRKEIVGQLVDSG
jgi:hypothetical protein